MKNAYYLLSACSLFSSAMAEDVAQDTPETMHEMTIVKPSAVSDEDLQALASHLSSVFQDGFQIGDLVSIFEGASNYLDQHYTLTPSEKRAAIVKTIDIIIDETNTPYVPDILFDPVFKLFVPPLVNVLYPDPVESYDSTPIQGTPSEEDILVIANNILNELKDGFTLQDVPKCLLYSVQFVSNYFELSFQEKAYVAKRVLALILDNTDTPYLPDFIFDDVFKILGNSIIDFLVTQRAPFQI